MNLIASWPHRSFDEKWLNFVDKMAALMEYKTLLLYYIARLWLIECSSIPLLKAIACSMDRLTNGAVSVSSKSGVIIQFYLSKAEISINVLL